MVDNALPVKVSKYKLQALMKKLSTCLFLAFVISFLSCNKEEENSTLSLLKSKVWEVDSWVFKDDNNPNWGTVGWESLACSNDDRWEFSDTHIQPYTGTILCNGQSGSVADPWYFELSSDNTVLLVALVSGSSTLYDYYIMELTPTTLILEYPVGNLGNSTGRVTFK